jgi:hypothetical protein
MPDPVTAPGTPAAAPAAPAAAPSGIEALGLDPNAPAPPVDPSKPAVADPAKPADAAAYTLKLPDDSLFEATALEGIGAFARDLGLSGEGAQKLVERDSKMLEQFADHFAKGVTEEHNAMVAKWAQDMKVDKELGGEKYAETLFLADKSMRMFATPEFRAALKETGFGSHPELMRVFVNIGRAIAEDSFTTKGAGDVPQPVDAAKTLFPTMN